jgi:hypothetical protein
MIGSGYIPVGFPPFSGSYESGVQLFWILWPELYGIRMAEKRTESNLNALGGLEASFAALASAE